MQYEISGKSLLFNNGQMRILKRITGAEDALSALVGKGQFEIFELVYHSGRINYYQSKKEAPPSQEELEAEFDEQTPKDMGKMIDVWTGLIYEKSSIDQTLSEEGETKKN